MRIFITGATGVIGRRAVPLLVAGGHRVTAVGRSPAKRDALRRAGAEAVEIDLFDADRVRHAVIGHDVVINLATHIPPSATRMMMRWEWRENHRLRREASAILADAALAAGVERFVQESFAPVYADAGAAWIDETMAIHAVSHTRTVVDAERSAARVTEGGRVGVVLRFAAFYGPDATQVHDMVRMIRLGWAPLPGAPEAFFSSVSHDDAASAVAAALTVPAGTYNVTDDEPLPRRDFTAAVAEAFDLPRPKPLPPWAARLMGSMGELLARSERMSNRKLRDESGWTPRYRSAREGYRAVADALRESRGAAA
ncbi:MAG TPA: NAD(P)H-binding protein [Gemmatimonadaceae bacterium]|nr:NAD(P)H-binding protein [Gemmatimonadaceae bacterium]